MILAVGFRELLDQGPLAIGDGYRAMNAELTGDGEIFLCAGHVSDTHIDFDGVERFSPELTDRLDARYNGVADKTKWDLRNYPKFLVVNDE